MPPQNALAPELTDGPDGPGASPPLAAVELDVGPALHPAWVRRLQGAGLCPAGPGAPPAVARICAAERVGGPNGATPGAPGLPVIIAAGSWEAAARAGAGVGARGHLVGASAPAELLDTVLSAARSAPGPGGPGTVLGWVLIGDDARVLALRPLAGAELPLRQDHLALPGGTELQRGGAALLAVGAAGTWIAWGEGRGPRWALVQQPDVSPALDGRAVGVAEVGYIATDAIHDIFNAHTYIQLGAAALQEVLHPGDDEELLQQVDDMMDGTARVTAIGNAVRAEIHRRIGDGVGVFELREVVLDALRVAGPRRGAHLAVGIDVPAGVRLRGNRARLREALLRAVQNASEVTADLGGWLQISAAVNGDRVTIDLDDDGPGFPPVGQTELVEPFQGLRHGGEHLGIGLSFIFKVAHELNGELRLEVSTYGGARVRLELPLALEDDAEPDPSDPWGDPDGSSGWGHP